MPKHATRRQRKPAPKAPNRDEEPKGRDTVSPTAVKEANYYVKNGFTSCEELIAFALRYKLWKVAGTKNAPRPIQRAWLIDMAKRVWMREESYPSDAELESQCARACELAREIVAPLSFKELLEWVHKQIKGIGGFYQIMDGTRAQVKHTKHLFPVPAVYDKEYKDVCWPNVILHERYGMYKLPNGEAVLRPVALCYVNEVGKRVLAAARRNRWQLAVRTVIRQNRDDAAANAANAAAADERRRARAQADAAAAAKQPRAYTAAGPSHKEGAAKWADEPATAAEAAKHEVAKAASLEAKAAAIAAKKEAEAQATAERLEQLRCLHVAEEIGGSH